MEVGQVRDGGSEGEEREYSSERDKVSANWDGYFVEMAFDGSRRPIRSFNVSTIEEGTGRIVMDGRRIVFPKSRPIFSMMQVPTDGEMEHGKRYRIRIDGSACSCCGIVESSWSNGFVVDTTPPQIGKLELNTSMLGVDETLKIRWENISDPESGISGIEVVILESMNNNRVSERCGELNGTLPATTSTPDGEVSLRWEECGGVLAPVTPLKVEIRAVNGASLNSTQQSGTSFEVAGVRITNLIDWNGSNSTGLFVCDFDPIFLLTLSLFSSPFLMICCLFSHTQCFEDVVVEQ